MEQRPIPFPSVEHHIALTAWEYRRLQTLNSEMKEVEQWISKRSQGMVLPYGLAAAQCRHADDGRLDEDVEVVAALLFLAGGLESGRAKAGDRVVAEISIPILSRLRVNESTSWSKHLIRTDVDGRSPGSWSRLLLDLYERALNGDKTKLLSIETICCDVVLIRQRLRSW